MQRLPACLSVPLAPSLGRLCALGISVIFLTAGTILAGNFIAGKLGATQRGLPFAVSLSISLFRTALEVLSVPFGFFFRPLLPVVSVFVFPPLS